MDSLSANLMMTTYLSGGLVLLLLQSTDVFYSCIEVDLLDLVVYPAHSMKQ